MEIWRIAKLQEKITLAEKLENACVAGCVILRIICVLIARKIRKTKKTTKRGPFYLEKYQKDAFG